MKRQLLFIMLFISTLAFSQPGTLDFSFNPGTGANGSVLTTAIQSDGKIILGGSFTSYNGTARNRIARLNVDGTLDASFNPGTGANNSVKSITIQPDGKIIIGGEFTSFNGTTRNFIARLNADGSLDGTFNPGTGANSTVQTTAIQSDGKIIIGGWFTTFNGITNKYIARLNSSGSLDAAFNPGTGGNNAVITITLQSNGKILIGGHFVSINGINRNKIARLNADGSLDTSFNLGTGANAVIFSIVLQDDGKIIIGGEFTSYNSISRNRIARLNTDGSIDTSFNPGTGLNDYVYTIAINSSGKIIIGGGFEVFNGKSRNFIARINTDGTLDDYFIPGTGANSSLETIALQTDGKIIIAGYFTSYNGVPRNRIARLIVNGTFGFMYNDINENCTHENEVGIKGRKAIINPGNIVVETNQVGFWYLDSLLVGTYTITADTSGKWRRTCALTQTFTITNPESYYLASSFGFVSTEPCAEPDVSINMPFLRPGFSNQKIYVKACNQYKATGVLNNAYVIVELDPQLTPQSGSQSYTSLGNNKYRFNLGNMNPDICKDFWLACSLSVNATLGETLCMKANLFPADSCVFDTIPDIPTGVTPCILPWDKSSLKVEGKCLNDSIRFVIYNTGQAGGGNMQCFAPVRIYVDGVLIRLDSIMLAGGDSIVFMFAGDGRTWRLEADQHPLHPGRSRPNATVENCGSGNWTPNLVNLLPHNDADPIVDIYCGVITNSYDPNDKQGFPLGITENHHIMPNQDIEYLIRFQNTGTDTAFTVIITDTLDTDLDIFSVISGVSSHNYKFRMHGPRVLEWRFDNILLPDSNVNEPASNGFVTFKVKQNKNLANGTLITNTANIYFDFNAPIITNTSLHTVDDGIMQSPNKIYLVGCENVNYNGVVYSKSGWYYQTINDTLYTISATINKSITNQNIQVCNQYEFGGELLTSSGVYYDTLTNVLGCDSVIILNLAIETVDKNIQLSGDYLTANESNATYQWLECSNGYQSIAGANSQTYKAISTGEYAVVITKGTCSDTSACILIDALSISKLSSNAQNTLKVYPNPASNQLTISSKQLAKGEKVEIFNAIGNLILNPSPKEKDFTEVVIDISGLAKGIYLVKVGNETAKVVVE
jgi:uncharacterized delta-60 repeat protein/uncharacterized repeat protein (TIGR01451 family)